MGPAHYQYRMSNLETTNISSLPSTRIQEVVASARWLLNMRWIAGIGVLAATWFARYVLNLAVPSLPLNVIGLVILTYNTLLCVMLSRIQADPDKVTFSYSQLAHLQVVLDWLAMTGLIHFSGGVESPLIFFFIFHIIIVSLLFNQRTAVIYAFTALLLVGVTVWLEFTGILPHVHVIGFLQGESYKSISFVIGIYGAFTGTSLVSVYLSSSIAERLRHREDQLGTLYLAAQTINSTLDLPEVLNRLVKATAEAMNVSGASIGLLDPTGSRIETAAAFGLSESFMNKGPILLEEGYIHTRVISTGDPAIIQNPDDYSMLQYPAEMEAEGIRSSIYVRLQARRRPLGVVRVYAHRPNLFTTDDARFLSAIAAQGAVAIENALAYQALKKLDLDKSQFVRSVTHELRSPVTGAQSLLRGMIKGFAGELNDRQRDIMGRLSRRLDKLEALINDLLDLAAGRSDMKVEESKPLSLAAILEQVVTTFEPLAREKGQTIVYNPAAIDPIVVGTEEGLDRIFTNLVGNAVKYTPEHGNINITVQQKDHLVTIMVADSGIGIPEQSLNRLFSEFYRAPNAKAFETGTGLGLVIVKELVDTFGGRISVESKEGHGATFTVHLPLAASHPDD